MSPKQRRHPPDVPRPWIDAHQDGVSVMPKARAAPNVSQKKRGRERPVSLPRPRELPCRRGVCLQVCRASHSALVKARGTCSQRARAQGGDGGSFQFCTQVGREATCVGNSASGPHSQPWVWAGLGARCWGVPSPGGSHGGRPGRQERSPFSQVASSRIPGSSDLTLPHSKLPHTFPL